VLSAAVSLLFDFCIQLQSERINRKIKSSHLANEQRRHARHYYRINYGENEMRVAKIIPKSSHFHCLNFKFLEKSIWHEHVKKYSKLRSLVGIKLRNNSAFRDSLIALDVQLDFCLILLYRW
jgi:hypothetical protein